VAAALGVAGLGPVLEDLDLVALLLPERLRRDRRLRGLGADVRLPVVVDDEDGVEGDRLAVVNDLLDLDHVALLDLLLFAPGLDHRVHLGSFPFVWATAPLLQPLFLVGYRSGLSRQFTS